MSEKQTRAIVATTIRTIGATAKTAAEISGDGTAKGVMVAVFGLLEFVAVLVEKVGVSKADELLKELVDNPALPLTDAELKKDVEDVKSEFVDTVPPNPFGSNDDT